MPRFLQGVFDNICRYSAKPHAIQLYGFYTAVQIFKIACKRRVYVV